MFGMPPEDSKFWHEMILEKYTNPYFWQDLIHFVQLIEAKVGIKLLKSVVMPECSLIPTSYSLYLFPILFITSIPTYFL